MFQTEKTVASSYFSECTLHFIHSKIPKQQLTVNQKAEKSKAGGEFNLERPWRVFIDEDTGAILLHG